MRHKSNNPTPSSPSSTRSFAARAHDRAARGWATLRQNRAPRTGLVLVCALVAFALVAPLVTADPNLSDFARGLGTDGLPAGPSATHLLGADTLLRDELARLAHGARLSLGVAFLATALATSLGALVGTLAGYAAGGPRAWLDAALMRLVDALLAFPYLLLVLGIAAALDRPSAFTVPVVLGLTGWLGTARVVRAKTIEVRGRAYVEAARALGASSSAILARHVAPALVGPLAALASASVAAAILAESALSYLGIGAPLPQASWGVMLYEAQSAIAIAPRLSLLPGAAIVLTVIAFNLVGEALRDAFDAPEVA